MATLFGLGFGALFLGLTIALFVTNPDPNRRQLKGRRIMTGVTAVTLAWGAWGWRRGRRMTRAIRAGTWPHGVYLHPDVLIVFGVDGKVTAVPIDRILKIHRREQMGENASLSVWTELTYLRDDGTAGSWSTARSMREPLESWAKGRRAEPLPDSL